MNSLPVKILTAVLTFALGVGISAFWLNTWKTDRVVCHSPVGFQSARRLEIVFVLDTTGSMGGLLDTTKQRIWRIVNGVMREHHASVRVGLVAYRDRGEQYRTQVLPLSDDLDKVYATLMDYQAQGGGDGPEDVRSGLAAGVLDSGWSEAAPDLSQVIFLVGDAPPHDDYYDVADTVASASEAVRKGIIVSTIQCGFSLETQRAWQMIADSGHGQYFAIASDTDVQALTSPYDEQLAELARKLDATVMPYGFRAYPGDFLDQIENGSLNLDSIYTAQLPKQLRGLTPYDQRVEIERRLAIRRDMRHQILLLSKQRDAFLEAELKKRGDDGFDAVVLKALRAQMARESLN